MSCGQNKVFLRNISDVMYRIGYNHGINRSAESAFLKNKCLSLYCSQIFGNRDALHNLLNKIGAAFCRSHFDYCALWVCSVEEFHAFSSHYQQTNTIQGCLHNGQPDKGNRINRLGILSPSHTVHYGGDAGLCAVKEASLHSI